VYFADVNGDKRADLINISDLGIVEVWPSDGTRFVRTKVWPSPPIPTPRCHDSQYCPIPTKEVAFADVSGDGIADAIYIRSDGIWVLRSTGTSFESGAAPSAVWSTTTGGSFTFGGTGALTPSTFFSDMDFDGKADAVEIDNSALRIYPSSGHDFGPLRVWLRIRWSGDYATGFADINGDHYPDCLANEEWGVYVFPSNGNECVSGDYSNGQFANWTSWIPYGMKFWGNYASYFVDISGDGLTDLVTVDEYGRSDAGTSPTPDAGPHAAVAPTTMVSALLSTGTSLDWPDGSAVPPSWLVTTATYDSIDFADVDGDRRVDLIATDSAGFHVFLSDGSRFVEP
jgi:hypothetical protein